MPLCRVFAAAIFLSTLAFAQNARPVAGSDANVSSASLPSANSRSSPANDSEIKALKMLVSAEAQRYENADHGRFIVHFDDGSVIPGGALADTTCYTMRSYLVARDSKDSDATHPVGYSTCQRATQYRLKSTQLETNSSDR